MQEASADRIGMELFEGDSGASQQSNSLIQTRLQTGRSPFEGGATLKILLSHLNEPAVVPSSLRTSNLGTSISPELDSVVLKCLAKSTSDRFQSARELFDALNYVPESNQWNDRLAEQWWTCNCIHYQTKNG